MTRLCVLVATVAIVTSTVRAHDWPSWRGPEQNGFAREKAVVTSWSPGGENLLWKSDIGGRTTPIVMNGRLYANVPVGEGARSGERMVCLEADTGRLVWEHVFHVFLTDIVENRVGWTAPVGDPKTGHVYVHGTGGELYCFSRDGRVLWKRSLTEEFGRISGYGGRLLNPILDGDQVVLGFNSASWGTQAKALHRYAAFDKNNGALLWWAEPGGPPPDTTYSTPIVSVVDGRRLIIGGNADGGVYAMEAATGRKVWGYMLNRLGLNTSPVASGSKIIATHSEENLDTTVMGRVVCLDAARTGDLDRSAEAWRYDGCDAGYASPALANGRLYIVDNSANLMAFDAAAGKLIWTHKLGRVGKGSPVVTADRVIYVGEQNGIFHILRDAGERCESLDVEEFPPPDGLVDEIFGSPAVAGGRVYFMTRYGMYCLGKRDVKVEQEAIPPAPSEHKPEAAAPATLLIQPAEATLAPGMTIRLSGRVFDRQGVEIPGALAESSAPQTWTVQGVAGSVEGGTFTAGAEPKFSAGVVTARWGELEGSARIRVCPPVPFAMDFEDLPAGAVPPGWVGAAGKTQVVERDGGKVLRKLAGKERPSPPFMRLRAFAGPPIEGGYTVEADVLGTTVRDRFDPDMGLVNSRYRFLIMGMKNAARIDGWDAVPRLYMEVPFTFKPDVWYRMKFQVAEKDGTTRLRGKVWPRDEEEPKAWLIDVVDPFPHREGSPGIYAYSPGTTDKYDGPEVFFDNFKVHR